MTTDMQRRLRRPWCGSLSALLVVAGSAGAWAQSKPSAAPVAGPLSAAKSVPPTPMPGYLTPREMPDSVRLLGPPPAEGSGTKEGDVATYRATRRLEGTLRWALATRDAEFGAAAFMQDVSCALGVDLNQRTAPALFHLLSRVVEDTETAERSAKHAYRRLRPFVENGGPICVKPEDWLRTSYSYPSGHSTFSWTAALVLEEIAPDRASDILSRARSYGESRVVCGVHYESDVQAGRTVAAAVFSALQASAAFNADLDQARREMARLRSSSQPRPAPEECRIEAEASARPVW